MSDGGGAPVDLSRLIAAAQATTQALNNLNQTVNSKFPNWVAAPATATSTGVAGQVAFDSSHFYVCVSSNVWVRAALSTF